ncbi:addiction module toxin, HicA family protein [Alicyclobacillus acidoterrestris]|uniref:type II toxin-antitoxin system HicA family toxin n=1 Tax=Alicyclobacillus suci TaxID=2816080 RepID=UPI00119695F2|nr:type II toxin-antitoxin system HicA family toxin [Alicyclobacillus suci]GEO26675.1 addiction module toxin, HicA family protein [Alicyclobacillus acidoterrestris]
MKEKPIVDKNKSYSSAEIIAILKAHGWELDRIKGSHHWFVNPEKGNPPIPVPHPQKDVPYGTRRNIFKQAGLW